MLEIAVCEDEQAHRDNLIGIPGFRQIGESERKYIGAMIG